MEISVLGCSGGIGSGRRTTSLKVNGSVLIDGGTGLNDLDAEAVRGIRHLFLTHAHLDHVAGLPFLLETMIEQGDGARLILHGLAETLADLREHLFNDALWPDLSAAGAPVLAFAPMAPGEWCTVAGVEIGLFEVWHTVPAAGYIMRTDSAIAAFSGDTGPCESLWRALNEQPRLDLLLVETAFPDEQEYICRVARHYCPQTLARDLGQLRHRPLIGLSHYKPGADETLARQGREALAGWRAQPLSAGDVFRL